MNEIHLHPRAMEDINGRPYMVLRYPIGSAYGRREPCNYYQCQRLYLDRAAYENIIHYTPESWWRLAKLDVRQNEKAQIII